MRLVRGGLRDLGKTIRDAQACLRPGGLFLLIEADQEFHSSERGKNPLFSSSKASSYPQPDGRLQGSSASPASDFVKMKLAKLDEDEDVSAVSEEGSWFSRVFWGMYCPSGLDMRSKSVYRDGRYQSHCQSRYRARFGTPRSWPLGPTFTRSGDGGQRLRLPPNRSLGSM